MYRGAWAEGTVFARLRVRHCMEIRASDDEFLFAISAQERERVARSHRVTVPGPVRTVTPRLLTQALVRFWHTCWSSATFGERPVAIKELIATLFDPKDKRALADLEVE